MSIKKTILNLAILCLASVALSAQGFLRTDGKDIVNEAGEPYILKGMGLGGWMLQEGYMLQTSSFANAQHQLIEKMVELVGQETTDEFYEAWRANHTNEDDIEAMHQAGFNSVRLPMHYNLYTLPIEDEPVAGQNTWLETGFALTDSLIVWCKARDMYVILDLHAAPGGQGNDEAISDRDEDKPNLWESQANQDKTVALWARLAERYKDEPTIGAYDLLNEVNYDLPGGTALRNIYGRITTAIRAVDQNHLIFIEGNWFANDFTGLTPPWDANMAYSPHKYWSINDQASIQWVINLRNDHNVPIYFGETGENSNVWFQEATKLFADQNMGWAWWPWKKIDAIAGPVSVARTEGWQQLIDYWEGNGPRPSVQNATAYLFELTDMLKLENARYQKDVIDALFRQNETDETIPYEVTEIPGVLYPGNFDMGKIGFAYSDVDYANFQVSTGTFNGWNNGWIYRNDGVDLEKSEDNTYTNGVHLGWSNAGEWMQYTVNIAEDGLYRAQVRTASDANGGSFHFQVGEADITPPHTVGNTGGWQAFQTSIIQNIPLAAGDTKLRIYIDSEGFNLGGISFERTGDLSSLATAFVSGITEDFQTVRVNMNKPLAATATPSAGDFALFVDGSPVPVTAVGFSTSGNRSVQLSTSFSFRSDNVITVSYTGSNLEATDGSSLEAFTNQPVQNTVSFVHPIPGRVQAENYFQHEGIQLETTTDQGGGQNIGYLDPGDFLDYYVDVSETGTYSVDYRNASEMPSSLTLQLVNEDGTIEDLHTTNMAATGGWQTWENTSYEARLPAGAQTLRLLVVQGPVNINYFDFTFLTSSENLERPFGLSFFPNPTDDEVKITGELPAEQPATILLHDAKGSTLSAQRIEQGAVLNQTFNFRTSPSGTYYLTLRLDGGQSYTEKIVKR
jgi:aryl-phospho-beta-D-glucosidase BglC (GH1 family)